MSTEAWREFEVGDRLKVVKQISETERDLLGREFEFVRYTRPHGYAVVGDESGQWWLHPEALEKTDG